MSVAVLSYRLFTADKLLEDLRCTMHRTIYVEHRSVAARHNSIYLVSSNADIEMHNRVDLNLSYSYIIPLYENLNNYIRDCVLQGTVMIHLED